MNPLGAAFLRRAPRGPCLSFPRAEIPLSRARVSRARSRQRCNGSITPMAARPSQLSTPSSQANRIAIRRTDIMEEYLDKPWRIVVVFLLKDSASQ